MSTIDTLRKFENLRAIPKSSGRVTVIQEQVQKLSQDSKRLLFAQSTVGGGVFIYESKQFPNQILEIVAGVRADDLMSCLYEPHPMFNTPGEAIKAREELIQLLERMHMAIPGTLVIDDQGRGRKVELRELVTMQIVDMIAQKFRDKGF